MWRCFSLRPCQSWAKFVDCLCDTLNLFIFRIKGNRGDQHGKATTATTSIRNYHPESTLPFNLTPTTTMQNKNDFTPINNSSLFSFNTIILIITFFLQTQQSRLSTSCHASHPFLYATPPGNWLDVQESGWCLVVSRK